MHTCAPTKNLVHQRPPPSGNYPDIVLVLGQFVTPGGPVCSRLVNNFTACHTANWVTDVNEKFYRPKAWFGFPGLVHSGIGPILARTGLLPDRNVDWLQFGANFSYERRVLGGSGLLNVAIWVDEGNLWFFFSFRSNLKRKAKVNFGAILHQNGKVASTVLSKIGEEWQKLTWGREVGDKWMICDQVLVNGFRNDVSSYKFRRLAQGACVDVIVHCGRLLVTNWIEAPFETVYIISNGDNGRKQSGT